MRVMGRGFVCVHVSDCRHVSRDVFVRVSFLECLQEGKLRFVQNLLYTCTQYPLVGVRRRHPKQQQKAGSESPPIPDGSMATYRAEFPGWALRGHERVGTHFTGDSVQGPALSVGVQLRSSMIMNVLFKSLRLQCFVTTAGKNSCSISGEGTLSPDHWGLV